MGSLSPNAAFVDPPDSRSCILRHVGAGAVKLLFGLLTVRCAPLITLLIAFEWALLGSAQAQDVPATDPWQLAPEIQPAAPDVFLLPDKDGKLRKVLGFRYENFLQAWGDSNEGNVRPPRYVVDTMETSGSVDEDHARLQIELLLTTHADGWVDIPLSLPNLIIQQIDLGKRVEGECLVYDAQRKMHVAWLQGEAGRQRRIVLDGLAKVTSVAGGWELEFSPPHATVSITELTVPLTDAEFEISPVLQQSSTSENEQTTIVMRGHASPLRVQWNRLHDQGNELATTLESVGSLSVRVDRLSAKYVASLQINSFGIPLKLVQVRLPTGSKTTRVEPPPELQAVVTETEDELGRLIEIRPLRPTGDPWNLELAAEQTFEEEPNLCELGGFEVVGAVRQSGLLELEIDEQLQAYFDLTGDLKQVALAASPDQPKVRSATAAFAYARFPWTLSVHMVPKQRRVNVRPQYELQINPDEARLQVDFDYQFSGANTFAVRIDLRGWQLTDDPLESGGTVDADRYVETQEGLLVLPLVNPDVQRARIALVVRRPIDLGEISFPLPEALGGFVLPGELTLRADPSLQVTTNLNSLVGLGSVSAAELVSAEADDPLVFRTFLSQASLDAEITRRARIVAVDVLSTVDVEEEHITVRQQFDYDVKHRPLSQILLQVPKITLIEESIEVRLDGKKVSMSPRAGTTDVNSAVRQMAVSLLRPLQRTFQIEVDYEIPYLEATPNNPAQVTVPLVIPSDEIALHEVAVNADQPRRVALSQTADADSWTSRKADNSNAINESLLLLRGNGRQRELPLLVRKTSAQDLQNAILERAWLQSWVAGDRQQDRAVFRFRSPHEQVHVELPPVAANQPLEVLLDGQPIEYHRNGESQISVALSTDSPNELHVLELRYHYSAGLFSGGMLSTTLPRLVCRPVSVPVFWHLVLPRGWQVARSPEAMASEFWLGWRQLRWGRQPTRSQSDLEQWSGATIVPPPPPSTSEYLYSAFEIPAAVEVIVARQTWLVAASTLAAFGVGLLCIYTSIASKVYFWLGLVLALLALLLVYPEVTLLVGQAVFWGGVMTLAAIVLKRTFAQNTGADFTLAGSVSTAPSASATESWVQNQRITDDVDEQPTIATQSSGSES